MKVGDRVRLTKEGREVALSCDGTKDWCLNPGVLRAGPFAGCIKVKRDGKGKASRLEVWSVNFWEPERPKINGEGKSHE